MTNELYKRVESTDNKFYYLKIVLDRFPIYYFVV